jgi:hypothetical protein
MPTCSHVPTGKPSVEDADRCRSAPTAYFTRLGVGPSAVWPRERASDTW